MRQDVRTAEKNTKNDTIVHITSRLKIMKHRSNDNTRWVHGGYRIVECIRWFIMDFL